MNASSARSSGPARIKLPRAETTSPPLSKRRACAKRLTSSPLSIAESEPLLLRAATAMPFGIFTAPVKKIAPAPATKAKAPAA